MLSSTLHHCSWGIIATPTNNNPINAKLDVISHSAATTIYNFKHMALCLGPIGSGKTLLLKKLQNFEHVDNTSSSVPTVGTNLFTIKRNHFTIIIRELGGTMAPLWNKYFCGISKVIYVVDASNLCQISAAGVLLYTILTHPQLKNAKFLLVLTKMDVSYRQMRNEALLMLQVNRLQKEIRQNIKIVEASAINGDGCEQILEWIA